MQTISVSYLTVSILGSIGKSPEISSRHSVLTSLLSPFWFQLVIVQ